jgi:hypothetical protein
MGGTYRSFDKWVASIDRSISGWHLSIVRRGSQTPPKTGSFGEGLRPRRNRRPKVSRVIRDLRSTGWLGQTGHGVAGRSFSASLTATRSNATKQIVSGWHLSIPFVPGDPGCAGHRNPGLRCSTPKAYQCHHTACPRFSISAQTDRCDRWVALIASRHLSRSPR